MLLTLSKPQLRPHAEIHPQGPYQMRDTYKVYRNKHSDEADFDITNAMYKIIMSEDSSLNFSGACYAEQGGCELERPFLRIHKQPIAV